MTKKKKTFLAELGRLAGWVLLSVLIGGLAGAATAGAIDSWYSTISKPSFTPPDAVFGPVWSLLYLLMGVAIYLARRAARGDLEAWPAGPATTAFLVQLALNGLWSLLFFGLQSPAIALVEIVFLWVAIGWTVVHFRRLSLLSAALLLPYWAWVTFAAVLNASIWWLNR